MSPLCCQPNSWFAPRANGASRKRPLPTLSKQYHSSTFDMTTTTTTANTSANQSSNTTNGSTAAQHHAAQHDVPPINPYHVLQIRRDATVSEIRDAYRRLALWHHPGRSVGCCLELSEEELQQRFYVFEMVAACYETLMDRESRHLCDQLLKKLEVSRIAQHLPMAGELHVGGQRFWTRQGIQQQQQQQQSKDKTKDETALEKIPSLSRSSTQSSSSSTDDNDDDDLPPGAESRCNPAIFPNLLPSCGDGGGGGSGSYDHRKDSDFLSADDDDDDDEDVLTISTSSTTTMDVVHYSEKETNRLFGGAMALLHQARQWKPFSDPHVVFEQVFGAHVFPMKKRYPRSPHMPAPPLTPAASPSAARMGSSRTLQDGTRIYTTSRILNHRQLTRIEKIVTSPTGQRQLVISVSSDEHFGGGSSQGSGPKDSHHHHHLEAQGPLMVAVSSSDEEQGSLFCLSQEWLMCCPFGDNFSK